MASLAQVVEYQIVALGVTGSSPVARPKYVIIYEALQQLDKLLHPYI